MVRRNADRCLLFPVSGPLAHKSTVAPSICCLFPSSLLPPPLLFLLQCQVLLCETSGLTHGVRKYIESGNRTNSFSPLSIHTHRRHTHTPLHSTVNLKPHNWLQLPPTEVFVKGLWPDHRHGAQYKETEKRKDMHPGAGGFLLVCPYVCVWSTSSQLPEKKPPHWWQTSSKSYTHTKYACTYKYMN